MTSKNGMIFVQIASYRDPELVPTVQNLLDNCSNPKRLRFGICWQHEPCEDWDNFGEIYKKDDRFRIVDVLASDSKGCCWARNLLQQQYQGEQFTLQLDSHHRLIPLWDIHLEKMYHQLILNGHSKPILTAYLPSYVPENDPWGRSLEFWQTSICGFSKEGIVTFKPTYIEKDVDLNVPIPARFYSAHFAFTSGQFCLEVPHDPYYYFLGEEINITVRAFTHGYELFHPNMVVAWHEYTRKNRVKQWDDDKEWHIKDQEAKKRHQKVFHLSPLNDCNIEAAFKLGNQRSLNDYEKFAGLKFDTQQITEDVILNRLPSIENININHDYWMQKLQDFN